MERTGLEPPFLTVYTGISCPQTWATGRNLLQLGRWGAAQCVIGREQACSDSCRTRRSSAMTRTDVSPAYVPWMSIKGQAWGMRTYVKHWEFREYCTELFIKWILCEFDLAHVEIANATDFEVFVDDLLGVWSRVKKQTIAVNIRWVFFVGSWIERYPRSLPRLAPVR